ITVYNGCGILVGQMLTAERQKARLPDMYIACDSTFMGQVRHLFNEPIDRSTNQLVILVPKGNPHGIKTLEDLGKPGLKIGVGHEKQCALGALTESTLIQSKLQDPVSKNVVTKLATGDGLVNSLLISARNPSSDQALDAVVAYVSSAIPAGDQL